MYTTLSETQRMFDRVPTPKELEVFPGAGHTDLFNGDPEKYRECLLPFLEKHLGKATPPLTKDAKVPD